MKHPKKPPPLPAGDAEPTDARDVRHALEDAIYEIGDYQEIVSARESELAANPARSPDEEAELARLRDDRATVDAYRHLAQTRGRVIEKLMRELAAAKRGPRRAGPRLAAKRKAAS